MNRTTVLNRLAAVCVVLAAAALVTGLWLGTQAQPVQLLRPAPAAQADLFGGEATTGEPSGTRIGSPQALIIRNQAVFLPETGEDGLRYVDEPMLTELGLYPLQLKTVRLLSILAVMGFLGLALTLWLGGRWSHKMALRAASTQHKRV
ncbi:hypothetical protein [Deinococcus aerophilus]|uniref:Uncharacterized protein n=1 Tax=Deinococcus aerophilus TaxID=522488 RepID=A0ABQ2H1C5_9DEIO|nr:hypothetical protein [Deinococcus aerophilus]GGM22393.1 hypothetical protein GCM10010841_32860 [Deinococcus aerophilus]